MRAVYFIASYLVFWAIAPLLLFHPKTRRGLGQRLGFYRKGILPEGPGPRLWLHGASAGDLLALSPMIRKLKERLPGSRIILSTTTNTGFLMASERLSRDIDALIYAPYDLPGATRRAAKAIGPTLLVLEYTEIWPNLIAAAKQQGARVALTNGRFSPSQMGRYELFFKAIGSPLKQIDLFLMREKEEAERALALGAPPDRVQITGNTKFDALNVPSTEGEGDEALRRALSIREGDLIWIAGSTHEGEEELLVRVFQRLRVRHPRLRLVLAPRYIDRAQRLVEGVRAMGLDIGRRSSPDGQAHPVVVLDTIGELSRVYRLATLVFVGGSFTSRGGQNILEPAGQGRPVLFGPQMENFRDSVQVLLGRGGIQVNDDENLYRVIDELLTRPESIDALGAMARASVRQVSGASARNVELLAQTLEAKAP